LKRDPKGLRRNRVPAAPIVANRSLIVPYNRQELQVPPRFSASLCYKGPPSEHASVPAASSESEPKKQ
jgi:hypothetical protein